MTTGLVKTTKNPAYPSLDTSRLDAVVSYLASRNYLSDSESVLKVEKITDSSRNLTVRVVTSSRSCILKCFLEWPLKQSTAPAAVDRFRAEMQFYRAARIATCSDATLPALLFHDKQSLRVVFEDLGRTALNGDQLSAQCTSDLSWVLVNLHHHSQSVPTSARYENWNVRQWLATGLFESGANGNNGNSRRWLGRLKAMGREVVEALGDARTALGRTGPHLVHGEFLPRNWLWDGQSWRMVDAEFSFFGRPEIDAGGLIAGLLARRTSPDSLASAIEVLRSGCVRYDPRIVAAFAGAYLCWLLDDADGRREHLPRGSAAMALLRRVARTIETGSLESFLRRRSNR